MPTFGLCDPSLFYSSSKHSTSSTGTFRVTWDNFEVQRRPPIRPNVVVEEATFTEASMSPIILACDLPRGQDSHLHSLNRVTMIQEQCCHHLNRRNLLIAVKAQALNEASMSISDFYCVTEADYMERASQEFVRLNERIEALRATKAALEREKTEAASRNERLAREKVEKARKEELEVKAKAKIPSPVPTLVASLTASGAQIGSSGDSKPTALKRFEEICVLIRPLLTACAKLEQECRKEVKDLRLKYRMNINRRIGQIANSLDQITNVTQDLMIILNKAYSISHEFWCFALITMAKKFLEQAETQICLHIPSAFPVAQVIISLSTRQKFLTPTLMYFMMNRSPFVIPRYVSRAEGQSEQDHKLAMGYLQTDGCIEGEQAYTERMAGNISLFAAIVQARPFLDEPSNYGIENGWIWLASFLNLPPQPISPYLLCAFLEVAGYEMWRRYGQHFNGLMDFLKKKYLPAIPSSSVAGKTRLEMFLGSIFKDSQPRLDPPEGSVLLP